MSKLEVCDLCNKEIMRRFKDNAYRITVKRLVHFYDGFQPWRGKQSQDICESCMKKIIKSTPKDIYEE